MTSIIALLSELNASADLMHISTADVLMTAMLRTPGP
jgi:hypothetical protein